MSRISRFCWMIVAALIAPVAGGCAGHYRNPPPNLDGSHLAGIWYLPYDAQRSEILVIGRGGSFLQVYWEDTGSSGETVSRQGEWRLEPVKGGSVRIHLAGAGYFARGLGWSGPWPSPCPPEMESCPQMTLSEFPFLDPFTGDELKMDNEVVLAIRQISSGQLVLLHMWTSWDETLSPFGDRRAEFRLLK